MKKQLLNLKIAVATLGIFFSTTASADFTAITSGNWSSASTWSLGLVPTSTVSNQNITVPSGITVTLDANVTFAGILNSLTVNGTLSNTTSNGITMTQGALAGGGTISVNKIMFTTLGTSSFSGSLNLKQLINSTTVLGLAAIVNIADTLYLESGNILLNTNANLTMQSNSTAKVNNGSITIGGGIFNSSNAYNAMYVGTNKTTGIELNTVTLQHLYLNMNNNNQTVTLNNNLIVNGDVHMNSGKAVLNGKQLTLKGNLSVNPGSIFSSNASSDLIIEGSGFLTGYLFFDAGSSINNITINRTPNGMAKIGSPLAVAGHLNLMDGIFSIEAGGMITMNAASTAHVEKGTLSLNTGSFTGTAAYNVEYMGGTNASSGTELSGTGLNNVTVNYSSSTNKVVLNNSTMIGGSLNMTKGSLDLNGKNLLLNGTISQNSNATFIGSNSSELNLNLTSVTNDTLFFDNSSSANQSLSKLKLNLGGTNPVIVIGTKLTISNELGFIKGKIALMNGDVELMSAASITGYDDTKYIVTSGNNSGSLIMNVTAGAPFVTFPVGTMANYSPAHVQQNSSASTGTFSVRTMSTVLSGGTSGFVNSQTLKVVDRTWFVHSDVSNINTNLTVDWVAAAEVNGFNRNNAYLSHFTSNSWDIATTSSATAGPNNTYQMSRTNLTSLSPFAVTEDAQALKVKELSKLAGIEVYPNPTKDAVNIKLVNSTDDYKYELTDITGRTILVNSNNNTLNKFDVSNLGTGCYFIKITNLTDNKTITKRFVKE
ncbi:MAG: T9SS type A sorting domain-containing protein [Bacteroidia bacterium]